jgi:hypothetical protein
VCEAEVDLCILLLVYHPADLKNMVDVPASIYPACPRC